MCVLYSHKQDRDSYQVSLRASSVYMYWYLSVAGAFNDIWIVICAVIPFHRASCPTQMSALHVSTDNLRTQKLIICCVYRDMLHPILRFHWVFLSDLWPFPHLHLFSHLIATPWLCLCCIPAASPLLPFPSVNHTPPSLSTSVNTLWEMLQLYHGGGGCSRGWGGPTVLADLMSSSGDQTEAIKSCVLLYS